MHPHVLQWSKRSAIMNNPESASTPLSSRSEARDKIEQIGKSSVLHTEAGVFAVAPDYSDSSYQELLSSQGKVDWEKDPTIIMGKRIVPYGENNNMPDLIRDIMDENNLAPGILEREMGLLYGNGPQLFKTIFEDGEIRREYVEDKEIQAWLDSWNFKRYVDMAMVEFKYLKGVFWKS